MAEFDPFSESYKELVTRSVRVSGEPLEYFAAYKASYLARRFPTAKMDTVLDYGCGIGALAEALSVLLPTARIDGFDPSQQSLDRVAPQLLAQGTFSCTLDSLGSTYDLIIIANVLHHVRQGEREALLTRAFDRLAVGGRVVVFEHNPINPLTRWAVSRCPFDGDAVLLKSAEVRGLLVKAGFREIARDFVVFFPRQLALFRSLEPRLGWLPIGAQYAFSGVRLA
jgi:2-polyprenyl-3-methyl-5-hydroxy-6-metoxy-1,4-benzoquinol methylase